MRAKFSAVVTAVTVASAIVPGAAVSAAALPSAGGRVGPGQTFVGLVNGSTGQTHPATIRMACARSAPPGTTGHPLPGQTVEVLRRAGGVGFTGPDATEIAVFFGPPPPGATATRQIAFHRYGVRLAIPVSLVLPCSGGTFVTFFPLPRRPPVTRPFVVPVTDVGRS